jgi:glyoxylate reductase
MTKVLITRRIFDEAIDLLQEKGIGYFHNEIDAPMTLDQIIAKGADAEALICLLTDKVDGRLMDGLPRLKVISNVAVGYDNIDVQAATDRGIAVTNTPDVLTECTADLAFALLLSVARNVAEADHYMRSGRFKGWELFQPHLGTDVHGKVLGIVGMGRIGAAVGRRGALGFGMKLLYADAVSRPELEAELGARKVTFPELLAQSDFVSVHTPYTADTHHLFTLREFKLMNPFSFIINTARGPIIKEKDLVEALKTGLIRGAALDVFENEPEIDQELARLRKGVLVVPHIGSATFETRRRMSVLATENSIAALSGKLPPNLLNPAAW